MRGYAFRFWRWVRLLQFPDRETQILFQYPELHSTLASQVLFVSLLLVSGLVAPSCCASCTCVSVFIKVGNLGPLTFIYSFHSNHSLEE